MHIYIFIYAYNIYREFGKYNIINPKPWSTHTHSHTGPPKNERQFYTQFCTLPRFHKKTGKLRGRSGKCRLTTFLPGVAPLRPPLAPSPRQYDAPRHFPFFIEKGLSAKLRAKFLLLLASPYPCVCVCVWRPFIKGVRKRVSIYTYIYIYLYTRIYIFPRFHKKTGK